MKRKLGPFHVAPIGLGCMSMSHAYGEPVSKSHASKLLNRALDFGYDFLDTATLYGAGENESLIGEVLESRRDDFILASKCVLGMSDGRRVLDGRPQSIKRFCEQSLKRLRTETIDLYYLHRLDPDVPIEESVGALADLVDQGKIRAIGLSEMSAATLRRAARVANIAAMQSEYSLWTRNPEISVLDACEELDVAFVAFSPVARGFLTNFPPAPDMLDNRDIRRNMPRFQQAHFEKNLKLWTRIDQISSEIGASIGQIALAWLLSKNDRVIPIPGTTQETHLLENFRSANLELSAQTISLLNYHFTPEAISGPRYNEKAQAQIDTEEFSFAPSS